MSRIAQQAKTISEQISELDRKILELSERKKMLIARKDTEEIRSIQSLIKEYGLSASDLAEIIKAHGETQQENQTA